MTPPTGSGEPAVDTWSVVSVAELVDRLALPTLRRTRIVAIDGRSSAGKSTLTRILSDAVPGSAVVATDDIAWNLDMFEWADELAANVLTPVRRGEPVDYRPPGWISHDRPGSVVVAAPVSVLFVEGVGSSRRALGPLLDASIWVQSDAAVAEQRGIARDAASGVNGDQAETIKFWHQWQSAERPFLADDAPWTRATVLAAGVPLVATVAPGTVLVADR